MEVDFYGNLDCNVVPVLLARLELPVLDRLDGFLVQAHAEGAEPADVRGTSARVHPKAQDASSLVLRIARFFGKLRVGLINNARSGHSLAHTENTAAHTHIFARSDATAVARSNTRSEEHTSELQSP